MIEAAGERMYHKMYYGDGQPERMYMDLRLWCGPRYPSRCCIMHTFGHYVLIRPRANTPAIVAENGRFDVFRTIGRSICKSLNSMGAEVVDDS